MHVVHVTPYFAPAFRYGGPPRSILGLCKALAAAGVSVEVVTTTANGDAPLRPSPPDGDVYESIRVHYAPAAFPERFFGARLAAPLDAALARADVCHVHGIWNVPEWMAARHARAARRPYIISTRGMLQPAARARHRWRKAAMFALVEQTNLRRAARVHTTSPAETASVAGLIEPRRIVELPNGVEVADRRASGVELRRRLGIGDADPVVLFLGRMHPIKRIDLLAAAMTRVRVQHPNAHLVLAGPDEGGHLVQLAGALAPLDGFVHPIGAVDREMKAQALGAATLVALCSDSESFGMSVVEALAAARPVVVARTCGWTNVGSEGCGVSVEQTVEALADGLASVVADPERARAMGCRGAEYATREFGWPSIAARMARTYEAVIAETR